MRFALCVVFAAEWCCGQALDPRNITTGSVIPDESYADQPYIVKTDDGAWLCVLTTGKGVEGEGGQHVISVRSKDRGKTWNTPVDVEPATGPEASYAVLLKASGGRVYVFYNHNTENIRQVIGDKPAYKDGIVRRVDSLGHFVFKYSDDHGRTWSQRRYDIPQRDFEIDRNNPYGGKLKFFWNVGKAFTYRGAGYVPLHKVGGFGEGFFTSSEGVLLRSDNILTEQDPARIRWETIPEGERGIRAPEGGGPIAEEQSFSVLSDGSIFCVFRTIDGHSAFTYSRDGGRSWEPSQYMKYADGRLMKHPRAANFAWKCENGKYLYWFHNHGGRFIREHPNRRTIAYRDRNPVWLVGGVEADSPRGKVIQWSQPEIVLYDNDPAVRMSYPDLVEGGGEYFLTETQKEVARVHLIDRTLIEGLWRQLEAQPGPPQAAPRRPGLSLEAWIELESMEPGQILVDNRTADGRGCALLTAKNGAVELVLNDGRTENHWASDPGSLIPGKMQHVVAIVDDGPKIISFVTNGTFNDGADQRQFGWGRYSADLKAVHAVGATRSVSQAVKRFRLHDGYLRTSEAIAAFRGGFGSPTVR